MTTEFFLKNAFEIYVKSISKIEYYRNFTKQISNSTYKQLQQLQEVHNGLSDTKGIPVGWGNMLLRIPFDNSIVSIGDYVVTIEDKIESLYYYHNKQYQWLLVEAYEAFEQYLEKLYSYVGFIDNTFWVAKDFGTLSINEIQNQNMEWFINQTTKKKEKPYSILKQIRKKIDTLSTYEKDNAINKNLPLMVSLISELRHVIVHKNGFVSNKIDFIEKVLSKVGLYNNGNYKNESDDICFIKSFFGLSRLDNMIVLLELEDTKNNLPIRVYYDKFEDLLECLSSYVIMIHQLTQSYLNSKNLLSNEDRILRGLSLSISITES